MSKKYPRKNLKQKKGPKAKSQSQSYGNLGVPQADVRHFMSLYEGRQLTEAQNIAQGLVARYPESAFAWKALGTSLLEDRQPVEALPCLERACELDGNDGLALTSLAAAYYRLGEFQKAVTYQEKAVELKPDYAMAQYNLAEMLQSAGNMMKALKHAEKAKELGFDAFKCWVLIGALKYQTKYFSEALEIYHYLEESFPPSEAVLNNLGNLYKDIGDYQKAESYYSRALDVNPDYVMAYSNIFYAKHYNPKATQEEIIAFAKRWDDRFALPAMPPVASRLAKGKALRVGLISSGFRTHPVGQMITTALENSQTDIQFYGYTTNDQVDQVTERLRAACSEWRPIRHLSQTKLAQLIRDDQIDILIDLSGHGDGSCLQAISMRPAPINVKWVGGLVNTMAVESIDYLLSDSIETPKGVDDQYTEKLIRLPDDYICYTPCPYAPPTTSLPALKNGYITLGCLNNPAKISAELLAEWAKLMHELPQSRILLRGAQYESESFCQKIRGIFASLGIDAIRVLLEGPAKHEEFLKTYQRIDIALDTWPYSGGLTTCEALLMGVPVVTLPGPTFAGRHSATHLINAGLQELVVNDWDEYRQRVLELVNDLPNLAVIRAGLRTILHYSPVCDAPRFATHFNKALRAIWVRYCEGKPPEALTFNKEGELWFEDDKQPLEFPEVCSEEATESKAFEWQLQEPITIIDNAAVLPRHPDYPKWMASGHLTVISFDPASLLNKRVEALKEYGELHHYPHALLGDGQPTTLYATLDAEKGSTLKPLPEEQQPEYMRDKLKVLAELPINTVALDQIEGLPSVDMLVLDDLHDAMAVLENGRETLKNTLLIQVKVAFQPSHVRQPNLAELQHWASLCGFRFYTLTDLKYHNPMAEHFSSESQQGGELISAQVLLFPNQERMENLTKLSLEKAAYIFDEILNKREAAAALLNGLDHGRLLRYCEKKEFISKDFVGKIDIVDVKDICRFSYKDPAGIAVIMPCIDKSLGLKTAKALVNRAGMPFKMIIAYDSVRQGFIKTLNDFAQRCEVRYVVYLAQDAFPGRGWLSLAYKELEKTGKGLLAFNDGKWQGKIASFGMVRRSWAFSIYGNNIFYPEYMSHCADDELTYLAELSGDLVYNPHIVLCEVDFEKGMLGGGNIKDRSLLNSRVASLQSRNSGCIGADVEAKKLVHGYEASVEMRNDIVVKKYKDVYFDFNKKYKRKGEAYFLKKYSSPFFVKLISEKKGGVILENAGNVIGRRDSSLHGRRLDGNVGFSPRSLVRWLLNLKEELKQLGIQHRDINPLNIVYSKLNDQFKLIDFGWAVESRDQQFAYGMKAPGLNPYARYDNEAIFRMVDEAKGLEHLSRELHLVIVWGNGASEKDELERKLLSNFKVLDVFMFDWGEGSKFNSNMKLFYGENLPEGCKKEKDIGVKPFYCYVVEDCNPVYGWVKHWGKNIYVNKNIYSYKMENRKKNGEYFNFIHATNDQEEFYHDACLLLGEEYPKRLFSIDAWDGNIIKMPTNVKASGWGWSSIEELFYALECNLKYVVLRNFENLPGEYTYGEHGDIDLLVDNLELALKVSGAEYVKNEVHYRILIKGEYVHFDFRHLGDGYYDEKWQSAILSNSLDKNGFRSPSLEDYFFSLIYHCLIHKSEVKKDYVIRLQEYAKMLNIKLFSPDKMVALLDKYMQEKEYRVTLPQDKSVFFNSRISSLLGYKYSIKEAMR